MHAALRIGCNCASASLANVLTHTLSAPHPHARAGERALPCPALPGCCPAAVRHVNKALVVAHAPYAGLVATLTRAVVATDQGAAKAALTSPA